MSDASPEQSLEEILGLRPESSSPPPPLPAAGAAAKAKYGVIALSCPFVAMGIAIPMSFLMDADAFGGDSGKRGMVLMAATVLPASIMGIALAIRAIARREAWFGAAVFALLLNGVTAAATVFFTAMMIADK